jgi:S-adenosylmethionine:tRNA ribosyltransferase-isomerase
MKKSEFFYNLPLDLIAQTPLEPRDQSRLLVYNKKSQQIQHRHFFECSEFLRQGDVLVVNDTKVLPAKLNGLTKNGKVIQVLLHKKLNQNIWEILVKNSKRYKPGEIIEFGDKLKGEFLAQYSNGNRTMQFMFDGVFESILEQVGSMPLPHYIKPELVDNDRYQTIYAQSSGNSVAAPTAGLHFTDNLIQSLKSKGIEFVKVNLTVGLGTFRPVKTDNIHEHQMHSEFFEITQQACDSINTAKQQGRRVIAVGTTSVRVCESAVDDSTGQVVPQKRDTNIFIYPPYKFKIIDGIITNFHLPESTLIMLVAAFLGTEQTLRIYDTATLERYRFYSFGDAMLIL